MTFFIGVDLHKTQFTVHIRTEDKIETLDGITTSNKRIKPQNQK